MQDQEMLDLEKKMLENYDAVKAESDAVVSSLQTDMAALDFNDIKEKICSVWSKIKPFIAILEKIPFVGKYVSILATLLNALCAA